MKGFFDIHSLKGKKISEVFGGDMAKKQGEHDEITKKDESEFKNTVVVKKGDASIITMKDGKPKRIHFLEGKKIGEEDA